jgi:hypothetical protein
MRLFLNLARVLLCSLALLASGPLSAAPTEPPAPVEAANTSPEGDGERQARDKAAARQLGVDGLKALKNGDHRAAENSFTRALDLVDVPTLHLGRARALRGLSRYVEAGEEYRLVILAETRASNNNLAFRTAADDARKELVEVDALIGFVTVSVTPEGPIDRLELDGKELSSSLIGTRIPVDPGSHQLRVAASGYAPYTGSFDGQSGQTVQVTLNLVPTQPTQTASPPPTASSPAALQAPAAAPDVDEATTPATVYWLGGATAVLGGAAIVSGVLALGAQNDFDASNRPEVATDVKQELRDEATTLAWVSSGLTAAAIAAGVATVVALFSDETEPAVSAAMGWDGTTAFGTARLRF